jgi:hypothetical protein
MVGLQGVCPYVVFSFMAAETATDEVPDICFLQALALVG